MHASENVVFRLDAPLLDPRLVERAEKELKKWTPFVWSVPSKSPFVLHEWEFDFFTQMDDPFRTRWLDDAMEWKHIYDVATNKHIEADMQRFGSRLASRELARHQPVDQLMTAKEALAVFRLSVVPTTADEVVAAYRARVENPADIALLKRAKDTLLIRIAGPQYVGD
jgi:hypothetical protein